MGEMAVSIKSYFVEQLSEKPKVRNNEDWAGQEKKSATFQQMARQHNHENN
jgi:hypothetical protein